MLPLQHPAVVEWRAEALGDGAPWAPTLLVVGAKGVRGYVGRKMAAPLARRLGPARSMSVLRALGSLRESPLEPASGRSGGLSRQQFLRLGAGTLLAGGLMFGSSVPAFAADPAAAWVAANRDKLPTTFEEFSRYPIANRKAIYRELSPAMKRAFWQKQLDQFEARAGALSAAQRSVLAQARESLSGMSFEAGSSPSVGKAEFRASAQEAFGTTVAMNLFTNLGPAETGSAKASATGERGCTCATTDDWCDNEMRCRTTAPCVQHEDCGWWWNEICNGFSSTIETDGCVRRADPQLALALKSDTSQPSSNILMLTTKLRSEWTSCRLSSVARSGASTMAFA